jgi:hypothetical protein
MGLQFTTSEFLLLTGRPSAPARSLGCRVHCSLDGLRDGCSSDVCDGLTANSVASESGPTSLWAHKVGYVRPDEVRSSDLTRWRFTRSLVASDTSIKPALEPVKLFKCIGKGGCEVGGRFAVQPVCLY